MISAPRSATRPTLFAGMLLAATQVAAQSATPPKPPSIKALEKHIVDYSPATKVEKVDHDRISARRIDIVGDDGTIRMTLSGAAPAPIIDGIQYKRAFNVSGLVLYDSKGSERGGFGVADVPGGSTAVLALDHPAMDAIGWRVDPDGSVMFAINQAPALIRDPDYQNRLVPGVEAPTRIKLSVAANGTPAVALSDAEDHARVRMTVTPEGYGAIEFLNAAGEVIHVMAPERDLEKKG